LHVYARLAPRLLSIRSWEVLIIGEGSMRKLLQARVGYVAAGVLTMVLGTAYSAAGQGGARLEVTP
jgi:hypothetical protein